jgi:hypothetical protein
MIHQINGDRSLSDPSLTVKSETRIEQTQENIAVSINGSKRHKYKYYCGGELDLLSLLT